ncbi:hypothetical protein WK04_06065 [Burkholderia ubonensis]|nr:hypothetical protein WK04_06065 [Burkholderia ubonensis]
MGNFARTFFPIPCLTPCHIICESGSGNPPTSTVGLPASSVPMLGSIPGSLPIRLPSSIIAASAAVCAAIIAVASSSPCAASAAAPAAPDAGPTAALPTFHALPARPIHFARLVT